MAVVTVQELVEGGVHFGHQTSLWNPKMRQFIYGKRNLIHVIDLRETVRGLLRARHFLLRLASMGAQILFIGTKRQIKDVVAAGGHKAGMPIVIERWIGGTLTNYHTIRSRLDRLEELERLEESGSLEKFSKKLQSRLRRELRKIRRNLGGIRTLGGLPGAIVVVDPKREEIAVKEAAKMNVPIVAILDTDCNPDLIDIPIPGNDDALRSVQMLLDVLVDAIVEGRQNRDAAAPQFRSEVPELRGREEAPPRPRGARPGVRRGRVAQGRFAERGGFAETVSFGRQTQEELEAGVSRVAKPSEGPGEVPSETSETAAEGEPEKREPERKPEGEPPEREPAETESKPPAPEGSTAPQRVPATPEPENTSTEDPAPADDASGGEASSGEKDEKDETS